MSQPDYKRLNKDDAVVLLVDHQTGLISLVQDFAPTSSRTTCAPWVTWPSSSAADHPHHQFRAGPNGPLVPELKAMFPDAPYIARPGQINAWDNEDFVKAIGDRAQATDHCRRGHRRAWPSRPGNGAGGRFRGCGHDALGTFNPTAAGSVVQ